jgi:predicted kinase
MKQIVIITGQLASLKTTIAKRLAVDLKALLLCKDDLKEALANKIKTTSREANKALSQATFSIMHHILEQSLLNDEPVVFEGNFKQDEYDLILKTLNHQDIKVITLYLHGEMKLLYERYLKREASRHETHRSVGTMNEATFQSSMAYYDQVYGSLDAIETIDTTYFTDQDYQKLITHLKERYELKLF